MARPTDSFGRIAVALEKLLVLYELELISKGIVTRTGDEEGEVYEFDADKAEAAELEEEARKKYGLGAGVKPGAGGHDGTGWRPGDSNLAPEFLESLWGPTGLAFPVGPEGAEAAEQVLEAERGGGSGATSLPQGRRDEEKSEG